MAETVGELIYKITADNAQLKKKLKESNKKVGGFGKSISKLGGLLAGVFAVTAIVNFTKKIVKLGSDAEETASKFGVVFKGVREEADKSAKNLTDNYGLSSRASQQLLSDTGDLLSGFGIVGKQALDLSSQVQTLAVDLASFTNFSGGAEGASAALTKALLGERESVKALGIAILEEDVKAKIKSLEATGELTNETDKQKRAIATLAIAQEQSKNAIGDFDRTSQGLANQLRILGGRTEDLFVEMSEGLLPIVNKVVTGMANLLSHSSGSAIALGQLKNSQSDLNTAQIAYNKTLDGGNKLAQVEAKLRRDIAQDNFNISLKETKRLLDEDKKSTQDIIDKNSEYTSGISTLKKRLKLLNDFQRGRSIEDVERLDKEGALLIRNLGIQDAIKQTLSELEFQREASKEIDRLEKQNSLVEASIENIEKQTSAQNLLNLKSNETNNKSPINFDPEEFTKKLAKEQERLNAIIEEGNARIILDEKLKGAERIAIEKSIVDAKKDLADLNVDNQEEATQKVADSISKILKVGTLITDSVLNIAGALNELTKVQTQNSIDSLEESKNARLAILEEQFQKELEMKGFLEQTEIEKVQNELAFAIETGDEDLENNRRNELEKLTITDDFEKQKRSIEEETARKQADLEYRAQLAGWKFKLASAIATAPLTILNAITGGFGAPFPLNLALPAILGVAAGVASGIQIAAIAKAKPQKPSFAVGAFEIPQDVEALVHRGEAIIPKTFAEEVRQGTAVIGTPDGVDNIQNGNGQTIINIVASTGEKLRQWIFEGTKNGEINISEEALVVL